MIRSEKYKFIFISVPKTGSSSIEIFFRSQFGLEGYNSLMVGGKEVKVRPHITALEIKQILGQAYNDYKIFGFVREPFSKVVSSYYYYRNGEPSLQGSAATIYIKVRVLLSRIFPLWLWALVYPVKLNKKHLTDHKGVIIVDNIGVFENIQYDFNKIVKSFNMGIDTKLPHINKSKHSDPKMYFKNSFIKWLMTKKLQNDIDFYNRVRDLNLT